jgi:RecJ-like exonuclease
VADDELRIRATEPVDVRRVARAVREAVPNAGVSARGGTDRLVFVTGERERVREATLDAVAAELSG